MLVRCILFTLVAAGWTTVSCFAAPQDLPSSEEDGDRATMVDESLYLLPGFEADVLYRHPLEEGSWVSLAVDNKGRLITSNQYGGLYRITLPAEGSAIDVASLDVNIGGVQGLLYAFDSLYAVVNQGDASGLYRLRDTNGDDAYDEVERLRVFEGEDEHGPHGVILSPDGEGLYIIAGNGTALPEPERSAGPRNWADDGLLSYGGRIRADRPGGWVCKTDPNGETFELIASGFRNAYDIAFNVDGELFTYDSDAESDMSLPWYRPTRVNHVTSGAEFGWRDSDRKWPDYYFDSLGSVYDVGPASPTGLTFGYGARFPAKYQRALFMCDWSYGKIYVAHLTPQGASYTAEVEPFLSGTPLPAADIVLHPDDGALYFVAGGRGTSSALYRVRYTGEESTAQVSYTVNEFASERDERHRLERYHWAPNPGAVDAVWSSLGSEDRAIRFAARVALELQPLEQWLERAFDETDTRTAIAALAAVARSSGQEHQERILNKLMRIEWEPLATGDRVDLLRVFFLAFSRTGPLSEESRAATTQYLDPLFPASDWRINRELCQMLAHLDAPNIISRTLVAIHKEHTQEEKLYFLRCLSTLPEYRWSLEKHREYFAEFSTIFAMGGGKGSLYSINRIRNAALGHLSDERTEALDEIINAPLPPDPYTALQARDHVKDWTVDELLSLLNTQSTPRNFEQGKRIYGEALCSMCHRFAGPGGITGPDLTGVAARYDNRSILESLLTPDKVIPDQYNTVAVYMKDGQVHTGRITDIEDQELWLLTDLFSTAVMEIIRFSDIDEITTSSVSTMPTGLLNSFKQEDILDLVAYLKSQGNPDHELFSR